MQEARVEVHSADKVAYVERIWCVLSDVKRGTKAAQSRVSRGASDFLTTNELYEFGARKNNNNE